MSRLQALQTERSVLKAKKRSLNSTINKKKDRRDDVEKLIRQINGINGDFFELVNSSLDKLTESLAIGVQIGSLFTMRSSEMRNNSEKDSDEDTDLSGAVNYLYRELRDIADQIDDLDCERRHAENRIDYLDREISEERRRIAAEALREAARQAQEALSGN